MERHPLSLSLHRNVIFLHIHLCPDNLNNLCDHEAATRNEFWCMMYVHMALPHGLFQLNLLSIQYYILTTSTLSYYHLMT